MTGLIFVEMDHGDDVFLGIMDREDYELKS